MHAACRGSRATLTLGGGQWTFTLDGLRLQKGVEIRLPLLVLLGCLLALSSEGLVRRGTGPSCLFSEVHGGGFTCHPNPGGWSVFLSHYAVCGVLARRGWDRRGSRMPVSCLFLRVALWVYTGCPNPGGNVLGCTYALRVHFKGLPKYVVYLCLRWNPFFFGRFTSRGYRNKWSTFACVGTLPASARAHCPCGSGSPGGLDQ